MRKILALRGPNLWARATVLECWVEFAPVDHFMPNWNEWLVSWLPGLESILREVTHPDRFTLAGLLQQITLHLASRSDLQLGFCKTVPTSESNVLRVIVQFDEEKVSREAFELARRMIDASLLGRSFDVAGAIAELHDLADDVCLGPSTRSMVDAALVRGTYGLGEGCMWPR